MNIDLLGIDIAKDIFQLHGVNKAGHAVLKKRITRNKLAEYIANLPNTEIAMESCGGANYWARVFQRSGHTVKLISPQFVKPFVKTNKNDANDREAIAEAASRPSMNFVPIKKVEQQDIQSLHRVRSRVMKNKIALINEIRGLNLEYGITIHRGVQNVRKTLRLIIDDDSNELTLSTRELMEDLYVELKETEERLKNIDKKIKLTCKENELCRRILTIPGIGELTASAVVASVGDPKDFKNGRHMAAWLGLVPRQSSSGNKQVLLGISKRGDRYLRTLLIHGARAVLRRYKHGDNAYGRWVSQKRVTHAFNKAAVAVANKNARIIFSLLRANQNFDPALQVGAA